MTKKTSKAKPAQQVARLEYMDVEKLQPWKRNAKQHDIKAAIASIRRFGYTIPIALDEKTGKILAGHGRVEAVKEIKAQGGKPPKRVIVGSDGEWLIPCIRGLDFENEEEAEAYLLADNRVQELAGYDETVLNEILGDMQKTQTSLAGTGWTEKDISEMLGKLPGKGETAADVGPKPAEKLESFIFSITKQMTLLFDEKEYDQVVVALDKAQQEMGASNHSEVLKKLLEQCEYWS